MKYEEMTTMELFKEFESERGSELYKLDYINNRLVIAILLTSEGLGATDERFNELNESLMDLYNKDKEKCEEAYDKLEEAGDNSDEVKRILSEYNLKLPNFPLPNPYLTANGYNDPCSAIVAYWYLDEVIGSVSKEDIGRDRHFTVNANNFCGLQIGNNERMSDLIRSLL